MRRNRRMPKRGKARSGPKADWVYRPNLRDEAGSLIDDLGTYDPVVQTLLAADPNANAAVLYDSHNRQMNTVTFGAVPFQFPRMARAEGGRAKIIRVQGQHIVTPSTWALGSTYRLGIRFGIFEQDPASGAFLIDPSYGLWVAAGDVQLGAAAWANDRKWQHEMRYGTAFSPDRPQMWNFRFNFSVNRRLMPNECYGMFYSTFGGSVTTIHQMWYRTLVADEG